MGILVKAAENVTKLRKEKYIQKKNELIDGWRSTRVWFAPNRGHTKYIILMLMGRSRRRVSKPIEKYVFGSWTFSEYKFGNQVIHVEENAKQDLIVMRFHNVGLWMRFHIMKEMLCQEKKLIYTISTHVAKLDSLWVVSRLWYEYCTTNIEVSIGRWIVSQPGMKRLMKYRSSHSTRDDLWMVQEVTTL